MLRYVRLLLADGREEWVVEDEAGQAWALTAAPFAGGGRTARSVTTDGARILPPIAPGSKIVAVGRNYAEHAREMGKAIPEEPILFMKPLSSLIGDGEAIVLPFPEHEVHHEAELAVVIGRKCARLAPDQVPGAIFGYTCANDVSDRVLQRKDGQWIRGKGFDTFLPLGPAIVPLATSEALQVRCLVNGQVRQDASTELLLYSVHQLIAFISHVMTLEPGDVILTGTPAGVGPIKPGDIVSVEVAGVGRLTNPVVGLV